MSLKQSIDKFIPKHFGGNGLLNLMDAVSFLTPLSKKRAIKHLTYNREQWEKTKREAMNGRFIENQHKLKELLYGKSVKTLDKMFTGGIPINASNNSCGIVAIYNVFEDLGLNPDFSKLLFDFERKGVVLLGYFGSSFRQIVRYIRDNGLKYEALAGKKITPDNVDRLQSEYRAFIMMTYNNSESVFDMMHTMSITDMGDGYQIHNSFDGGLRYPDLKAAVFGYNKKENSRSKPVGIIGIKR